MDKQVPNIQIISLHNKLSDSSKLSDFLASYAKTYMIPDDIYNDLRLVLEEAFVNIASYAFTKGDTQTITVEINSTTEEISITFRDAGIAFDPLTMTEDRIETDDHSKGGMGIHIIKSLTDHQKYCRVGHSNVFTVTKHYTK